jgi:hypothetical protein
MIVELRLDFEKAQGHELPLLCDGQECRRRGTDRKRKEAT